MLGEDIDALRDAVRDFAQAEIAPRAAGIDRTDQFDGPLAQDGRPGLLGITVGDEYSGAGMDPRAWCDGGDPAVPQPAWR